MLFILPMALCAACFDTAGDVVYNGHNWVVKQLNDSVLICVPNTNNETSKKPFLINIKDFSTTEFEKETTTNDF